MARRSPARLLAPLALVGFVFALVVVVKGSLPEDGGGRPATKGERAPATTPAKSKPTPTASKEPRTYVVKAGDTPSSIAVKTGVTLAEIERLNPDLDAQLLAPGDRLKLRP
jgi:teichoic acid transport system ATP-binding protein